MLRERKPKPRRENRTTSTETIKRCDVCRRVLDEFEDVYYRRVEAYCEEKGDAVNIIEHLHVCTKCADRIDGHVAAI